MTATPVLIAQDYLLLDSAVHGQHGLQGLADAPPMLALFDGTPEQSACAAGVLLAAVPSLPNAWFTACSALDARRPCLTLLSSPLKAPALAEHLRRFLNADLGDGQHALLRFYDPCVLPALLGHGQPPQAPILDPATVQALQAPIAQWRVRGHGRDWQGMPGAWTPHSPQATAGTLPLPIELTPAQLDRLLAAGEADYILGMLVELGLVSDEGLAADRWEQFLPRYVDAKALANLDTAALIQVLALVYVNGIKSWQDPAFKPLREALAAGELDLQSFLAEVAELKLAEEF